MALSDLSNASNEAREQRIMRTRNLFFKRECITIASVCKKTGYQYNTVLRWAKDGDIPLLDEQGQPVVPVTKKNAPVWLLTWLGLD